MRRVDESNLVSEIESINNNIENFELERQSGTKALKNKFHEEAVEARNAFVKEKTELFESYKKETLEELKRRVDLLLPTDKTSDYQTRTNNLDEMQELLLYKNPYVSNAFKLGFEKLVYKFNEDTSFVELNKILTEFVDKFTKMNLNLNAKDFSYTMFTEEYFTTFFNDNDENNRKEVFEKIYWECPKLILQIRQSLFELLKEYEKELEECVKINVNKIAKEKEIDLEHIEEIYNLTRQDLESDYNADQFIILNDFLTGKKNIDEYINGSPVRIKLYDSFTIDGSYKDLSAVDKSKYKENINGLYHDLNLLKRYYKYESIVVDLIQKYQDRTNVKSSVGTLLKEINKNNKERAKLNKAYLKSCGYGLFSKKNVDKQSLIKVKMNELFEKELDDFNNYEDTKISINLDKYIKDGSSIHDLLYSSLSTISYLIKSLEEVNKENSNFDLEKELKDYIDFVYDPNGKFLESIFAFNDFDVVGAISNKYHLLGVNIDKEKISKEELDKLLSDVSRIYLIQKIENNNLSLENIKFICEVNKIVPIKPI